MINKKVAEMLNKQINLELYSGYVYLEIVNYYADQGLDGFANWFMIQVQEEWDHAMLMRTYLINNNEKVSLSAIGDPTSNFKNKKEPLEAALKHEEIVTAAINDIYEVAINEKDYRSKQFLDWFVAEQGEEEKNANELISKFELFGEDSKSLYMLDQELAGRVYTAPSLTLD